MSKQLSTIHAQTTIALRSWSLHLTLIIHPILYVAFIRTVRPVDIIKEIQKRLAKLLGDLKYELVQSVGLFGSLRRMSQREESDVGVVIGYKIEVPEPLFYSVVVDLIDLRQEELGREIEMIPLDLEGIHGLRDA